MKRNRKQNDNEDSREEWEYERNESVVHKDFNINFKAFKWFEMKYLENFEPYISYKILEVNGIEERRGGILFEAINIDEKKYFSIVTFHQEFDKFKQSICNILRTLMFKIGLNSALKGSFKGFLVLSRDFIQKRQNIENLRL